MNYYFSKELAIDFERAIAKVIDELGAEGFGIITEIDVKETLKQKLNVDFRRYLILGACNPQYAYQALQTEDKIGTMLPCNVVIQENSNGKVEVTVVDPMASMQAIDNPILVEIASLIQDKLKRVIDSL